MGNERSEAIFEVAGLVVDAPENCPLYKATYVVFGSSHRFKDDYEERGSVRYVTWIKMVSKNLSRLQVMAREFRARGRLVKMEIKLISTDLKGQG
jgi:hypothetical protein